MIIISIYVHLIVVILLSLSSFLLINPVWVRFMVKSIAVTDKVHQLLSALATKYNVNLEALANILIMLVATDNKVVEQAILIIRHWKLGGATKLEKDNRL